MEMDIYKKLLIISDKKGFDISKLKITPQKSYDWMINLDVPYPCLQLG